MLYDLDVLFEGIKRGAWKESPVGDVFLSAMAASVIPGEAHRSHQEVSRLIKNEEAVLANAISLNPKPRSTGLKSRKR